LVTKINHVLDTLPQLYWHPTNKFVYPHGRARNSHTDTKIIINVIELNIFPQVLKIKSILITEIFITPISSQKHQLNNFSFPGYLKYYDIGCNNFRLLFHSWSKQLK